MSATAQLATPVVTIPDERLLAVCDPMTGDVSQLIADLFATAKELDGSWMDGASVDCVGLAAPQIGVTKRVFVLRHPTGTRLAFVNPEITKRRGKVISAFEKCFSEPGVRVQVPRFTDIEIRADGGVRMKFKGFTARVVQHEMDHLDGKLISRFLLQGAR